MQEKALFSLSSLRLFLRLIFFVFENNDQSFKTEEMRESISAFVERCARMAEEERHTLSSSWYKNYYLRVPERVATIYKETNKVP